VDKKIAKTKDQIEVTAVAEPGGSAHFSISGVRSATHIPMHENPNNAGVYTGVYAVNDGDRAKNAKLSVVLTTNSGKVHLYKSKEKILVDTIPPTIKVISVSPKIVGNGGTVTITLKTKPHSRLFFDVSHLDTTQNTVDDVKEKPNGRGIYVSRILINKDNKAHNGIKKIKIFSKDAVGNESNPVEATVELRNSELRVIRGLKKETEQLLNKAEIHTLQDMRRANPNKISKRTHTPIRQIENYIASSKLLAVGFSPDVSSALAYGGISSPVVLAEKSEKEIENIIRTGVRKGLISAVDASKLPPFNNIIELGKGIAELVIASQSNQKMHSVTQCGESCVDENSIFSCHAYLNELVKLTGLGLNKLERDIMQDFYSANNVPVRRVDICAKILDKAMREDTDFFSSPPPRLETDWEDYDEALNKSLVGILLSYTRKSPIELQSEYRDGFDSNKPLNELNQYWVAKLRTAQFNNTLLHQLLAHQTGITKDEELKRQFPDAFNDESSLEQRNENLQRILGFPSPAMQVDKIVDELSSMYLDALVKQSKKTRAELRARYYFSFFPDSAPSITTTCMHAISTLQEYLSEKRYANPRYNYPSYDEWRVNQVKSFYPENIYTHEFKTPGIRDDRQLLKQHLEQAQTILDSVRVSRNGNPPGEDPSSMLNSFAYRNPYYTNMKAGLDLINKCLEIDELITKGHEAYFNEEYQMARQHYLNAAEKIRDASKNFNTEMGKVLQVPLWSSEGRDSYFRKLPLSVSLTATKYLKRAKRSFDPESTLGITLGQDEIELKGLDEKGTFLPVYNARGSSWSEKLKSYGWNTNGSDGWAITPDGKLYLKMDNLTQFRENKWSDNYRVLVYENEEWTDFHLDFIADGEYDDGTGIPRGWGLEHYLQNGAVFRFNYSPQNSPTDAGYVRLYSNEGVDRSQEGQIAIKPLWPEAIFYEHLPRERGEPAIWENLSWQIPFTPDRLKKKITITVQGEHVEVILQTINNSTGEAEGNITVHANNISGFVSPSGKLGLLGIFTWNQPSSEFGSLWRVFPFSVTNIHFRDLSPAKGPFSDKAFFLEPLSLEKRTNAALILAAYDIRKSTPAVNQEVEFLQSLPSKISLLYDQSVWIIDAPVSGKNPFDKFFGRSNLGLWYADIDYRINRDNLRKVLDSLPMLFCHQFFFLLPICLGDVANALGQFEEALQWYRLVHGEQEFEGYTTWYPYLNPKIEVEMMRIRIARNYVDWGDFLFSKNTVESSNEARTKYGLALYTKRTKACCEYDELIDINFSKLLDSLLDVLEPSVSGTGVSSTGVASRLVEAFSALTNPRASSTTALEKISRATEKINRIANSKKSQKKKNADLIALVEDISKASPPVALLDMIISDKDTRIKRLIDLEKTHPEIMDEIEANLRAYQMRFERKSARLDSNSVASSDVLYTDSGLSVSRSAASSRITSNGDDELNRTASPGSESYADSVTNISGLASYSDSIRSVSGFQTLSPQLIAPSSQISSQANRRYTPDNYCIPRNPVVEALSRRACLGIRHVNLCFTPLGYPQNDISIFRFEYLISAAKNFAQMALAAEKDFIQFKDRFENDTLELMNATQAVAILNAGVRLSQLRVTESIDQLNSSSIGLDRIRDQAKQIEERLNEIGGFWSWAGGVLTIVGAAVSSFATAGAAGAAIAAAAATTSFASSKVSEGNDIASLRRQLQSLRTTEYNAARQNITNAKNAWLSALQQTRIAELEAQFAAEKASFLSTEFFNPQLWSLLAQEVKKNYRTYLTYATTAAWLAQRALEFERGIEPAQRFSDSGPEGMGSGLGIVRFDYFQHTLQGLLGADALLRDIATLEAEKLFNERQKKHMTKVISLVSTRPYLFASFINSGILPFATTLNEFDEDYQGHYQRRIKNVRINIFGLIGQEGVKATLSCLGISKVVSKEILHDKSGQPRSKFVEKTLRRPPESIALTSPQSGGIAQVPLLPAGDKLNPFEDHGVETQWVFEMPKHANKIDYNTITDIQIIIDYTALDDPNYRLEVIKQLPLLRGAVRAFSFRMEFPDALFHLLDTPLGPSMVSATDEKTGRYTIVIETKESDYPPNQANRKLTDVVLYIRSKGSKNFSHSDGDPGLKVYLVSRSSLKGRNKDESDLSPSIFRNAAAEIPPDDESAKFARDYIGKWEAPRNFKDVIDRWYIYIPPDENDSFLKRDSQSNYILVNGHKVFDFTDIADVVLGINYTYEPILPPQPAEI
jgi:hypothetical protein